MCIWPCRLTEMHDRADSFEVREVNAPIFIAPISTKSNVFFFKSTVMHVFREREDRRVSMLHVCMCVYKEQCVQRSGDICKWQAKQMRCNVAANMHTCAMVPVMLSKITMPREEEKKNNGMTDVGLPISMPITRCFDQ